MRWLTLALLVLYPVAWTAPLLRAGLLPFFSLSEISVVTGFRALWDSDVFLALVVGLFGFIAPYAKTIGLALVQFGRAPAWLARPLALVGRLAMADIFLIALYVVIAKGVGVGRVEVAWGLYLFTALILASLWIGWRTERGQR
ncbi:paraquat-inducible protein A [Sulfitobacter sp. D35]|uniref:paraquat-inducible protein A n=1 Tax=Sulfitobacter sp. D35 TaxID=3083252 RepID=UPI00296F9573|nr:paraquat-inducible protein A [Sulfitobacter sp. D35]MDW4496851.1 paraquat-inducible protein A [Sulfitobacter sp. D35]